MHKKEARQIPVTNTSFQQKEKPVSLPSIRIKDTKQTTAPALPNQNDRYAQTFSRKIFAKECIKENAATSLIQQE